jgi:hypothetical protein
LVDWPFLVQVTHGHLEFLCHCDTRNVLKIMCCPSTLHIYKVFFTDIIFAFAYMCTQYLLHIHPPLPLPHFFPLLLVPTSSGRASSTFLFSDLV